MHGKSSVKSELVPSSESIVMSYSNANQMITMNNITLNPTNTPNIKISSSVTIFFNKIFRSSTSVPEKYSI